MRRLGTICCGLILLLLLAGVLEAQVIRSGPIGRPIQIGPVGGGFSGGLGNSGFNGVGSNPLNGFDMKSRLPDIDPAPPIQHEVHRQAITTHETYAIPQQTTSESDKDQSQHLAASIGAVDLTKQEIDSNNHQLSKHVHAGEPPEEEDSDDDDSEEGEPWWLWLLIALVVVGVVVKSRK